MSEWIRVKDKLPPLSFIESDDIDDPHEAYPFLVFSSENPGIFCVAHLEKEQNEESWEFEELYWLIYIPGEDGMIQKVRFETFTHWMPLPEPPK